MIRFTAFPQIKGLAEAPQDAGCRWCKDSAPELIGSCDCCRVGGYALPKFQSPGHLRCAKFRPKDFCLSAPTFVMVERSEHGTDHA